MPIIIAVSIKMGKTPAKPTLAHGQSLSESDLLSATNEKAATTSAEFNVTMRNKRIRLEDSPTNDPGLHPEFSDFKTELLEMLTKWKANQEQLVTEESLKNIIKQELGMTISRSIKELVADQLSSINERLNGFHDSLQFFNEKFEDFKKRIEERDSTITSLQADNERLKSNVNELTTRLGVIEQHLRESNIEINGIPENKNENLANTLIHLSTTIGSPLNDTDILQITRIAKLNKDNDRPRSVIAKLQSPRQRDTILAAVSSYNKKNPEDKLSSHHLGIAGNRTPVFVSEHLSPANKQLHAAARKLAKETSYKFVWIRNGRIFVRKDVNHDSIFIRNVDTLKRMRNN